MSSLVSTLLRTRVAVGPLDLDGGDLVALAPLVASLVAGLPAWPALPAEMAVHFSGGQPDRYMPRSVAVWLVPAIGLAAVAVVRQRAQDAPAFRAAVTGFVGWVVAIAHLYVLAWNLGVRVSTLVVLVPALGGAVLLVVAQKTRLLS